MKRIADKTVCKDGTTLSIQASAFHYSIPRDDEGPYSHVEVGFIRDSKGKALCPPDSWEEYADGSFPNNVYGYVPIWLVDEFIESHGGMAEA